jgi:endonuclease-3
MTKRNISAAKPAATKSPRRKLSFRCPYSTEEIEEIFRRFSVQRPEPKGELFHTNPYTLLVAVALSAQATDVGVNKATRPLFAIADTPEKMLELGEDTVRDYIKTIGLYRNKAKNVIALSQKLITDFGGEVPRTREELVTCPASAARPPTSSCRWRSGSRPSLSTRISSGSATG